MKKRITISPFLSVNGQYRFTANNLALHLHSSFLKYCFIFQVKQCWKIFFLSIDWRSVKNPYNFPVIQYKKFYVFIIDYELGHFLSFGSFSFVNEYELLFSSCPITCTIKLFYRNKFGCIWRILHIFCRIES